jgi:DNA-binding transcriptional MerR regulator
MSNDALAAILMTGQGTVGNEPSNGDFLIIGELSRITGLDPKTIRFYEKAGLITPRRQGKFRIFTRTDARQLILIRNLRALEMPIRQIRQVLAASFGVQAGERAVPVDRSPHVASMIKDHLARMQLRQQQIETQIASMSELLVRHCEG